MFIKSQKQHTSHIDTLDLTVHRPRNEIPNFFLLGSFDQVLFFEGTKYNYYRFKFQKFYVYFIFI